MRPAIFSNKRIRYVTLCYRSSTGNGLTLRYWLVSRLSWKAAVNELAQYLLTYFVLMTESGHWSAERAFESQRHCYGCTISWRWWYDNDIYHRWFCSRRCCCHHRYHRCRCPTSASIQVSIPKLLLACVRRMHAYVCSSSGLSTFFVVFLSFFYSVWTNGCFISQYHIANV